MPESKYDKAEVRATAIELGSELFLRSGPTVQHRRVVTIREISKATHLKLVDRLGGTRATRISTQTSGSERFLGQQIGMKVEELHVAVVEAILAGPHISRSHGTIAEAFGKLQQSETIQLTPNHANVHQLAVGVFDSVYRRTNRPEVRFGGLRGRMILWSLFDDVATRQALRRKYELDTENVMALYAEAAKVFGRTVDLGNSEHTDDLRRFVDLVTLVLDGMILRSNLDHRQAHWAENYAQFFVQAVTDFVNRTP
jgi:hypothetical protein